MYGFARNWSRDDPEADMEDCYGGLDVTERWNTVKRFDDMIPTDEEIEDGYTIRPDDGI